MSVKPIAVAKDFIGNEKRAAAGIAASFVVWWLFVGRKKYGAKGMKKYV